MALSGSIQTNSYVDDKGYSYYYILSWSATQSVANNQSSISWTLTHHTNGGWIAERTLVVTLAGKTLVNKTDRVQRYPGTVSSGSFTVNHDANGNYLFTGSVQAALYTSNVNTTASGSFTLNTIPRKSTLSVGNGTLGTAQTLTVTRQSTSFTHTITATCGSASTTICTKSSSTSISFTPPLTWANQNTTGTSLTVTYTITTYNGNTSVGSNSYSKTCSIPASVKPSCSITVSDPTGYATTYGGYVEGLSKFAVTITPTPAQGSGIKSYSASANGSSYNTSSFTTAVIVGNGTKTITAKVTDNRGRTSDQASKSVTVLAYSKPTITSLKVHRCNANGVENISGGSVKITLTTSVTNLTNNTAKYTIQYKKSSASSYTTLVNNANLTVDSGVTNTAIFTADTGSSYDIKVTISDKFFSVPKTTVVSTAFSIMHFLASGLGMALGKIAELANVLDIGFQTRFSGGILQPVLNNNTDFNDLKTPNTYTLQDCGDAGYLNCPIADGTGSLTIITHGGTGQVKQRCEICDKTNPLIYERLYYGNAWGEWLKVSDWDGVLLWSGGAYMNASQTVNLLEKVSKQPNGIVLVFSYYSGGVVNSMFSCHFVHKRVVGSHAGSAFDFRLSDGAMFIIQGGKTLYIYDDRIVGHDKNTASGTTASGISYYNNSFVLRYVIGV